MRRACIPAVLLLAGCAAAPAGPSGASGPETGHLYHVAAGRTPTLVVGNGAGHFTVSVRGGAPVIEHDGVPVPETRVERTGSLLTVLSPDRRPLLTCAFIRKSGPYPYHLVYSPAFDPYTSYARIGITLGPADEARDAAFDLAANTAGTPLEAVARDEPQKVFLVSVLLPDGSAASAGLMEHDVVTHIDGRAVTGPNDLNLVVAGKQPGEVVVVRVMRERRPLDVPVEVGPPPPMPAAAVLEERYRSVIG